LPRLFGKLTVALAEMGAGVKHAEIQNFTHAHFYLFTFIFLPFGRHFGRLSVALRASLLSFIFLTFYFVADFLCVYPQPP